MWTDSFARSVMSGVDLGPDAVRLREEIRSERRLRAVDVLRHRIRLVHVQVAVVGIRDAAGGVEERVAVPNVRREAELVDDVILRVAHVVDDDLIDRVVVEREEVGPARRFWSGTQLLMNVTVLGLSGLRNA